MTNEQLGALARLDPRSVWKSEPQEFTPWLAENIGLLAEALGLDIEVQQREKSVGDFAVDLFGKEVGSGRTVIIENQLSATDHSHLGQLLTYAAGLDAAIIVWVTPSFRDEHRQAIEWLNQQTSEDVAFFGVQLELLQIDGSRPAADFRVVAQPSDFQRELVTATRGGRNPRQEAYHDFFTDLLARLKDAEPAYTTASRVGYRNYIGFNAGLTGFSLGAEFFRDGFRVSLYIDPGDKMASKAAFDQLHAQQEQVERELGMPLTWERLDDRRACRIFAHIEGSIDSPEQSLESFGEWAVPQLIRFKEVFSPRLQTLDLEALPEEAAP